MAIIPFATAFDVGLTTMGFTLLSPDGTVFAARSTTGVSEVGPGRYSTTEMANDADLPLTVLWDDGVGNEALAPIIVDPNIELEKIPRAANPLVGGAPFNRSATLNSVGNIDETIS